MLAASFKNETLQPVFTMQSQHHKFLFETEFAAIKFSDFKQALEVLPYGSIERIAIQLLAATGCRITELDRMDPVNLLGNEIFWKLGKNQSGMRKERLPDTLIEEIVYYRQHNRTKSNVLLGANSQTITRYFNDKEFRARLGGAWTERSTLYMNDMGWSEGFKLHLKGFRKTFQTILFAHFYKRYGDAGIALEWVSKRMRHSSKHITAYHYIQDYEKIEVDKWVEWLETGKAPKQNRILDYI